MRQVDIEVRVFCLTGGSIVVLGLQSCKADSLVARREIVGHILVAGTTILIGQRRLRDGHVVDAVFAIENLVELHLVVAAGPCPHKILVRIRCGFSIFRDIVFTVP